MTNPRFKPCDYVVGGFGRTDVPIWQMFDGGSEEKLQESVIHHLHALTFWMTYPALWRTEKDFCDAAGIKLDRFEAWQRGRVTMQPRDHAVLLNMFGPGRMPTAELIDAEIHRALRMAVAGKEVYSRLAHMRRYIDGVDDDEISDRTWLSALPLRADKGLSTRGLVQEAFQRITLYKRQLDVPKREVEPGRPA